MKKAVISIVTATAAAAVVAGVLLWNRSARIPPLPVARLLPPETVLLTELPDCRGTLARWPKTALAQLTDEPEVAAFLERPLSRFPMSRVWSEVLEHLCQADIRQGFFAVTRVTDNMPHAVGGIAFRATRREAMEAAVAQIRAQAQAASPMGKSETIKHHGCEIDTFAARGVAVAGAFAGDWYLFGNDVELLKQTLDRFAKAGKTASLATDPAYARSTAHLFSGGDFTFYVRTSGFIEKLLALSAGAGRGVAPAQAERLRRIQAVAGATHLENERIHDRIFVLQEGCPRSPKLTRSTLKLTSPGTLLYYAFAPSIPDGLSLPPGSANSFVPARNASPMESLFVGMRGLVQSLTDQGVCIEDFKAAFGPEFAAFFNWPVAQPGGVEPASAVAPTFHLAGQVRNAVVARMFIGALCAHWNCEEARDLTLWKWPSQEPAGTPTLGLTNQFLLAGLNPDSLIASATKLRTGGATLESSRTFRDALATVAVPGNLLVYVDARALFDRIYDEVRAMAMIWANFVPHAGDYVQMKKLPPCEVVSRHLLPMVLSGEQTQDGALLESSGPVTFFQGAVALGAFTSAAAVPVIEGKASVPGLDSLLETYLFGTNAPGARPATPPKP